MSRRVACDLHVHSSLLDGGDEPEALIRAAIARGLDVIGFAERAPLAADATSCRRLAEYRETLTSLQERYGRRIYVGVGIEQDLYEPPLEGFAHRIGVLPRLFHNGVFYPFSENAEALERTVREGFGGDGYRFVTAYFEALVALSERNDCRVIGSLDLPSRFNGEGRFWSEKDPRYLHAAYEAIDALVSRGAILEVSTETMRQGARRVPQPAPILLARIAQRRGLVTLASGANTAALVGDRLEMAAELLRIYGFCRIEIPGKSGWRSIAL